MDVFERSSLQEMRVATADFELCLSKSAAGFRQAWEQRSRTRASTPSTGAPMPQGQDTSPRQQSAEAPAAVPEKKAVAAPPPAGHAHVKAANLGTFYRAPKPGAPSYVEIGSRITSDTEVCLIEVMKLFTPLVAGMKGVIREVLVNDGALVEFDQPLFLVQLED
jgi:acetyl-CoA carboxylase biotin carboxyl carrier protein